MTELGDLRAEVLTALTHGDSVDGAALVGRVCDSCVRMLPIDGAGLSLFAGEADWETVYASDPVSTSLADLQFSLGEGPCIEAYERGDPVLVPDLARASASAWPVFATQVLDYPVGALFTFPIQLGTLRIATMDTYRSSTGELGAGELSVALRLAEIAMLAVVVLGTHSESWLDAGGAPMEGAGMRNREVHQAIGMLSVQLGKSSREALARMRAYAFSNGHGLQEVAADVVARKLRLDGEPE